MQNDINNDTSKTNTNTFSYGIIMGYYGPIWSNEVLIDYADFCNKCGYKYFIYAPKLDKLLREDWATPFTDQRIKELTQIRNAFEEKGIKFGIGLSPWEVNSLKEAEEKKIKL